MNDTGVYFDPYDVEINADPYPTYARLREEAPIYHNERYDFWALSRHADVQKALVNWQTFSSTRSDILDIIGRRRAACRRGHVRGPTAPHHPSWAHVARLHAQAHGGARGPGARVLRRMPRPARRCGRLRHHHRTGVDDADARDRHAPRYPRSRTRSRCATRPTPICAPSRASRWT